MFTLIVITQRTLQANNITLLIEIVTVRYLTVYFYFYYSSMLPIKALISTYKAFGLDETMNAFDGPKTKYN
jgi:hypothetical protein